MVAAITQSLPIAIGLLLAALPVVLVTLVLATKRPASVSWAFLGGWALGLAAVGAVVIAVADVVELTGPSPRWLSVVKVVLGAVLLALAVRKWQARPGADDVLDMPKWMAAIDSMTPTKALGLAFLLAASNPKNIAIVASGATVIADATSAYGEQSVAMAVFAVVASLGVAAPALALLVLGDRSRPVLDGADRWMTRNSMLVMAAVLLLLGLALITNGVSGF